MPRGSRKYFGRFQKRFELSFVTVTRDDCRNCIREI